MRPYTQSELKALILSHPGSAAICRLSFALGYLAAGSHQLTPDLWQAIQNGTAPEITALGGIPSIIDAYFA